MASYPRKFSHLGKRVHRPGLLLSVARRRKRWFKFRKRKVSLGSVCHLEKTRRPGRGGLSQTPLLYPLSLQCQSRPPAAVQIWISAPVQRACARGGAGHASVRPGSRSRGGARPRGFLRVADLLSVTPQLPKPGCGGGAARRALQPPPGPEAPPQRSHRHPV